MAAEPPWINKNSGVAARNGTTAHTIPFGFTSTAGNFLMVVLYGALTHADSGGTWTKRLAPVTSGELAVFTKTSTGEASFTDTINASNYPVVWAAYELPAGTTWTAGTSGSPTSDTFPALTGLPGTEQVVWAARGRVVGSELTPGGDTTWTSPWVEDADQFAADDSATDGGYLAVGHQINVTATSVTPAAATSYQGAGWPASDRQHVVFALAVPAADTTPPSVPTGLAVTAVGSTSVDLTWNPSTDNVGVTGYEVVVIGP